MCQLGVLVEVALLIGLVILVLYSTCVPYGLLYLLCKHKRHKEQKGARRNTITTENTKEAQRPQGSSNSTHHWHIAKPACRQAGYQIG